MQLNIQIHMGSPWIIARTDAFLDMHFSCGPNMNMNNLITTGGGEVKISVTNTVAAARRQASPTKNRIIVWRTIGLGAERRTKNQSGKLSAALYAEYSVYDYLSRKPYSRGASRTVMKGRPLTYILASVLTLSLGQSSRGGSHLGTDVP